MVLAFLSLTSNAQTEDLSVRVFKDSIQRPNVVVVDLRTPDELKSGIIKDAVTIDYFGKSFEKDVASLDRNKSYYLYCASGGRSGETLTLMKSKGFKKVFHLQGGMEGWKSAGMPVSKMSPK